MNKKFRFAILFAVLALSCCIVATGCSGDNGGGGGQEHEHSYTVWKFDDDEHWKECPDDGTIDESTRGEHDFVVGKCECGATEKTGPVDETKYGTVTGKVKLVKDGSAVTDNAVLNAINVDMGDDRVEITPSVADGVYSLPLQM